MEEKIIKLLFHHLDTPALAAKAARQFMNAVEATDSDEEASENRTPAIHPSALSVCLRQAAMELNQIPRNSEGVPESVRKAGRIGTALHRMYQTAMKRVAKSTGLFTFEYEVPLGQKGHPDVARLVLAGNADGVFTYKDKRLGWEIKSIGGDTFKKLSDLPEKHLLQGSVYQQCLKLDAMWFMYISRDSLAIDHRVIVIPENYWLVMRRRASTVLRHEIRDEMPPGTDFTYNCTMCSYKYCCPDPVGQSVKKEDVWRLVNQNPTED